MAGTPPSGATVDTAVGRPAAPLAGYVRCYVGYRYAGFPPGTHLGLPSPYVTVVASLGPPTRVATTPGSAASDFVTLASGMQARPATVLHSGHQEGVQLDLTPAGARALLGLPAGALAATAVDLDTLWGPVAAELVDRMVDAWGWQERFAVLDDVLTRRVGALAEARAPLAHAWHRIVGAGGAVRVGDLAAEIGWSRRHLAARFTREYGLTPKEAARVVRFDRSRWLLTAPGATTLAAVAAAAGYYDQAHLAREWADLAGCAPTTWLAAEDFPPPADTVPDVSGVGPDEQPLEANETGTAAPQRREGA